MGVRFCDITPELKQRLVRLVRKIAYLEDEGSNPDATTRAGEGSDPASAAQAETPAAAGSAPAGGNPPRDDGDEGDRSDDLPVTFDPNGSVPKA